MLHTGTYSRSGHWESTAVVFCSKNEACLLEMNPDFCSSLLFGLYHHMLEFGSNNRASYHLWSLVDFVTKVLCEEIRLRFLWRFLFFISWWNLAILFNHQSTQIDFIILHIFFECYDLFLWFWFKVFRAMDYGKKNENFPKFVLLEFDVCWQTV